MLLPEASLCFEVKFQDHFSLQLKKNKGKLIWITHKIWIFFQTSFDYFDETSFFFIWWMEISKQTNVFIYNAIENSFLTLTENNVFKYKILSYNYIFYALHHYLVILHETIENNTIKISITLP